MPAQSQETPVPFADTPETLDIFVTWGGALLILFAIIGGISGGVVWLGRRFDKRMATIAAQLDQRTLPIQSGFENGGNSLTDISKRLTHVSHELVQLRDFNEVAHQALGDKVDRVSDRLDAHAASALHDRRFDGSNRRSTDHEE